MSRSRKKRLKQGIQAGERYRELSMIYATGQPFPEKPRKPSKAERRQQDCIQRSTPAKRAFADNMRAHMTPTEKHLWQVLKKMDSLFAPQAIVHGYIADFCSFKYRVLVEVDGEIHLSRADYDRERDSNLSKRGYRTLRFTNQEVMANRPRVVARIMEAL
jgi:very-short-patch-repair endonuclease